MESETVLTIKIADVTDLENLYKLNQLFDNDTTKDTIEENIKSNDREVICIAYN